MKWLIVNGDDFSANGGIIEAHRRGILTSTSLIDPDCPSGYAAKRATELRTLCDPIVRQALAVRQIQLVSFRDLGALLAELPT
jgi:predicted glycoside hydrolase/deacetylase ChbG (UPF0249 family)